MHGNRGAIRTPLVCILLYLLAALNGAAQQPRPAVAPQQIAAQADEYMSALARVKHFSGSILIARDGKPVISKGYGMANYELGVPNTPQTVFRIGSITKAFTAIAVLMLQEQGKLDVDDPACKYLADCPAAWQPITIHQLLTHASGIPSYTAFPEYRATSALPVKPAEMIARFRDKPLEFAPGEKTAYNNSAYYLLGVIIERVSGKSYEAFLRDNIFAPVGMTATAYDSASRIIRNRADGYAMQDETLVNAPYVDMSVPFAAGALVSTAEDLLRWDQALYGEKLLSRKSLDRMFTAYKSNFGYGWTIAKFGDRAAVEKSGGVNGFQSFIRRFPEDHTTVIVLTNNSGGNVLSVADVLSAIAYGAPYEMPKERVAIAIDPKTLARYAGEYLLEDSPLAPPHTVVRVALEDGKLVRYAGGSSPAQMFAESEKDFFLKSADVQVSFVVDAEGRTTGLVWHRLGHDIKARKIK